MVLAALPAEPVQRELAGQSMRSVFGVLKERKLILTNPAVRLNHGLAHAAPRRGLEDLREALNSPDRPGRRSPRSSRITGCAATICATCV